MRIINLTDHDSKVYTSNAFLLLGDHSAIGDVNTLIDVGSDPALLARIQKAPTGVGKRAVEQVILTHSHSDHTALLPAIRKMFNPIVYAFSPFVGANVVLRDGQEIKCGDRLLQVIHMPGHSEDSILLYCKAEGALFVGDAPVVIQSNDATYDAHFRQTLARVCGLDVRAIYFGHGGDITENAKQILRQSLQNIQSAPIVQEA